MTKFKKPKKKVKKLRQKGKILSAEELAASVKPEDIGKDLGSRKRPKMELEEASSSKRSDMGEWMDIDDVPGKGNFLFWRQMTFRLPSICDFIELRISSKFAVGKTIYFTF